MEAAAIAFEGMPDRDEAQLHRTDGSVTVSFGPRVLFRFDEADTGMRNLAMVALAEAGMAGHEVAALFGLSADYFSTLRVAARRGGSATLVRPRAWPPAPRWRPPGTGTATASPESAAASRRTSSSELVMAKVRVGIGGWTTVI